MPFLVYYSSTSENMHRFVKKVGLPAKRIPIHPDPDESFLVEVPYILLVPTYGGGNIRGAVPKQVIYFLNEPRNRKWIRGVISSGDTNFGKAYCIAGQIIAQKCNVPVLYNFELLGTPEDVTKVRNEVRSFWTQQHSYRATPTLLEQQQLHVH